MLARFTRRSRVRGGAALGVVVLAATGAFASQAVGSGAAACKKTVKIAFVYPTASQNFAAEMAKGAKFAADQVKCVKLQLLAPANPTDFKTQQQLFDDATRTSTDGVALFTLGPPVFVRPVRDAIKKGIPIVIVDAQLPPSAGAKTFVGNNNTQAGYDLAAYVLSKVPKSATGEIVTGSSGPIPVLQFRAEGFKLAAKKLRPDLKVEGPFDTTFDFNEDFKRWSDLVKKYPDASAFLGTGDAANNNLALIKKSTNGTWQNGAFDLTAAGVQAIKAGVNTACMSPEHFLKGYVAVRLLAESALGIKKLPTGWWNPGHRLVTQKNVNVIIKRQKNDATRRAFFAPIVKEQFAHPSKYLKPLSQAK